MHTIIRNALVHDGLGHAPVHADVAIRDSRIQAIEPQGALTVPGALEYDAGGKILAPGFIDPHSHSDVICLRNPTCDIKLRQGCTTEIVGNCGNSKCVAVMTDVKTAAGLRSWDNTKDYGDIVEAARTSVNIGTLVGHNTVRERVMGYENRPATPQEMDAMKALISTALSQGACGLSSGLWYLPGKYAPREEIVELGACLRGTEKPYATHMRSEGSRLLESLDEAMAVARNGSGRLEVSHIKASPRENWHKIDEALKCIQKAKAEGLCVFADRYPYIYSATGLRMVLNAPWDLIGDIRTYLQDDAHAAEVIRNLDETKSVEDVWQRTILLNGEHAGQTLWDVSTQWNVTPGTATVRILQQGYMSVAFGSMCEENMQRWLQQPWVCAGSDSSAYPLDFSMGRTHPRGAGTFPLFFQIARKYAPAEEVIRRMTSLPAMMFNIRERGVLRPGYFADLVVFDEDAFQARSTFQAPHLPAAGVSLVFVNGQCAFDEREPDVIGRHGHFLRF